MWTGYRADEAGVEPGDLLVAINALPVTDLDQLELLAGEMWDGALMLTVDRLGEFVNIPLFTAAEAEETGIDGTGLVWNPPPAGLTVETVAADSRAADAGIRTGDRLLRIDGIEITGVEDVRNVLAPERETAAFLELERDGHRFWLLLR